MSIQQYTNNVIDALGAAITSTSSTSITVVSGVNFPSTGNFVIKIDSELMLCTARSTTTLTVVRGIEGTTAATHLNGTNVFQPLTMGALLALVVQLHGGTVVGSQRGLNFVDGGGLVWSLTDDPTNAKCNISATFNQVATYLQFAGAVAAAGIPNGSIFFDSSNSNKLSVRDLAGTLHTINLTP